MRLGIHELMDDAPETFSHILGVPWKLNFHFGGLQGGGELRKTVQSIRAIGAPWLGA